MSIFGFQRSSLNLQHFFLAFTKSIGWGPAVWLGVHWQVRCGGSSLSLQISSIAITAITDRGKRSYGLAISEDLRRLALYMNVECVYIYNLYTIMYYHVLSFIQPKTISVWIHVGSTLRRGAWKTIMTPAGECARQLGSSTTCHLSADSGFSQSPKMGEWLGYPGSLFFDLVSNP